MRICWLLICNTGLLFFKMKTTYKISDWEKVILKSDLTEKEKVEKVFFVKKAFEHNVPVILNLEHFSSLLGIKVGVLTNMIRKPASFYRKFTIPKRKGGFREIVTPHKSLLSVQQWICKHVLSSFEIHSVAYAYVKNKNVAKNATLHIGCNEMIKIDIKNFFPSINIARVRELFNRKGYSKEISAYLAYLCCLDGSIPQGAGSSPLISNIILYNLDKRLYKLSENNGVVYSRYADDLVFSSDKFHHEFKNIVISNIKDEGFTINYEKLKEYSESHRKLVTGILIKKDQIRLQKSVRKEIKEQVYYILRYGVLDQVKRYNDIYYIDRVLGRLWYWKQIEPNNKFVKTSIKKINDNYKKILLNN